MTPILMGVLFAAVQPELGSLRPQPLPPVRIIDPGGSISDLRDRVAGKAAELRFTGTMISIRFHPDKVWREWQTDAKGIAALERDLGGASASYFVNRDGEAVFKAGLRIDPSTADAVLEYCATMPVSQARDYYSGPARLRARVEGIDAPLEFTSVRCSNCHAVDGGGIPKGVIKGTSIRAEKLRNRRSASGAVWSYGETTFCRALTQGVDGSGRILEPLMPRYELTQAQCRQLWNYVSLLPE